LVKLFSVFAATVDVADTTGPLKYRHGIDAVEEISGGVRFGTINEFYLEASFETQKTPGLQPLFRVGCREFYNWNNPTLFPRPAILVDAIEDLNIYADGTRVTISLRIAEDKARSVLDARQ
jgi:hypothetical protein